MPGPQPAPTALKLLKGVRPARINQNEPKPRVASANIPAGWGAQMSVAAKSFWKRNAQKLVALGLLTEIDLNAFRALCEIWSDWATVRRLLKKSGMIYQTTNAQKEKVFKQRPEVKLMIDLEKELKVYLELFGMAPAPRSRIAAEPPLNLDDEDLD